MLTRKKVDDAAARIEKQEAKDLSAALFSFSSKKPQEKPRAERAHYSYFISTLRVFSRNRAAMVFAALMVILLAFAFLQPLLANQKDPQSIYTDEGGMPLRSLSPCLEYPFGTNSIGQDLWSRTWAAVRMSLLIAFAVAFCETVCGVLGGLIWGYVKEMDFLFTEAYNIWHNIPTTLLVILLSYVLKPGPHTLIFTLTVTGWLHTARFVRNQVMIIRDREYNLASRVLGSGTARILTKNILPYLVSVIALRVSLAIPAAISHEVFISYIGLGLPVRTPSLGNLIVNSIDKMLEPSLRYQLFIPAGILAAVSLSFYVAGSALADASDPKNHFL